VSICAPNIRKASDPIVLGESVNSLTTYGLRSRDRMQEPKATLCQIQGSVRGLNDGTHENSFATRTAASIATPASLPARTRTRCRGASIAALVTINDGKPARALGVDGLHALHDAPCASVCPVTCIYPTEDGIVLHNKDLCIGCGYCFYACPFGAPQWFLTPDIGALKCLAFCSRRGVKLHRSAEYAPTDHLRLAREVANPR